MGVRILFTTSVLLVTQFAFAESTLERKNSNLELAIPICQDSSRLSKWITGTVNG